MIFISLSFRCVVPFVQHTGRGWTPCSWRKGPGTLAPTGREVVTRWEAIGRSSGIHPQSHNYFQRNILPFTGFIGLLSPLNQLFKNNLITDDNCEVICLLKLIHVSVVFGSLKRGGVYSAPSVCGLRLLSIQIIFGDFVKCDFKLSLNHKRCGKIFIDDDDLNCDSMRENKSHSY